MLLPKRDNLPLTSCGAGLFTSSPSNSHKLANGVRDNGSTTLTPAFHFMSVLYCGCVHSVLYCIPWCHTIRPTTHTKAAQHGSRQCPRPGRDEHAGHHLPRVSSSTHNTQACDAQKHVSARDRLPCFSRMHVARSHCLAP